MLLAGDLVVVAVQVAVESIERVAQLEVRHGVAALRLAGGSSYEPDEIMCSWCWPE
jgi:hypothetical protein